MYSRSVLKQARLTIVLTLVASAIASFSLSLIPFAFDAGDGGRNILSYIIAAVFWSGLMISFVAAVFTKKILHKQREQLISEGYVNEHELIGLLSFSKNRRMYILYVTTILGLVMIVLDIIIQYLPETVMLPVVSVTIFSFATHCVIDGKYYKAYKQIKEIIDNETKRKA